MTFEKTNVLQRCVMACFMCVLLCDFAVSSVGTRFCMICVLRCPDDGAVVVGHCFAHFGV